MDFSGVCLDGVLGMSVASNNNQLKHCRATGPEMDLEQTTSRDQDWRSSGKMARTESYLMRSASMLSDASHNAATSDLLEAAEQQAGRLMRSDSVISGYNKGLSGGLPFGGYQYTTSNKPSGVMPLSNGGMHGMFPGSRMNPFTASQWQELEHQALIFKYMMAGVQVPPDLLIPIRKNHSLNIFSSLSSPGVGCLRPNLGWSSFHLGFANNADPEPGRCRRTDGKKWRCSRDAVPDQKYCERHMNRGRHRSRKPVEGQTNNQTSTHVASTGGATSVSSAPTTTSLAAARSALISTNTNTAITNNSNASSLTNLRHSQQQQQHLSGAKHSVFAASIDASATPFQIPLNVDRYLNGMKGDITGQLFESQSQSMNSSLFNDNAWRSRMVPQAGKTMSFETRTLVDEAPDFGLGQMNLLPMTAQRNESQQQRPAGIRHFFDDWPTATTRDRSTALSWSEIEQMRSAAASTTTSASSVTQLSISIPSDFSSPASPNNKLTLSPLKLSTTRSGDPLGADMGLGVGMGLGIESDHHHRQRHQQNHHHHHQQQHTNWIPITWESPVGGPLAEVLNSTTATPSTKNSSSSSALNLMTGEGWDCSSTSPGRGDTSPTGVLQKTFGSLSDSSTGSSPRAIKAENASLCENLRTAAFVTAAAQISTT
ncbi:hypothetical protein KI387_029197 [Taxus chinensis]|uniref:Growth-regulating factor n=1 Tax=Taxus chinensis TaxID=29808 RepID=A0AA38CCK0_TAXCH|nr:hypothetical protein KI387_029197 [Taxus chinensis]